MRITREHQDRIPRDLRLGERDEFILDKDSLRSCTTRVLLLEHRTLSLLKTFIMDTQHTVIQFRTRFMHTFYV